MACLSTPYPFKFFKGCFPQSLLGPFLNTFPHILSDSYRNHKSNSFNGSVTDQEPDVKADQIITE